MRKPVALTARDRLTAATARPLLESAVGKTATVEFTKQDGTPRTLVGTVVEVTGSHDKEVVRVETVDGFRSANVWRVHRVTM